MIKAIIFDLDDTLANRKKATSFAYRALLQQKVDTCSTDPVLFETMVQDLVIWDEYGAGNKEFMLERLEKRYGVKVTSSEFHLWWESNLGKYEPLFDNSISTLEYLKNKGYKLGIITNGSEVGQNTKLDNVGIRDYFETIIISGACGLKKPQKEIFQLALDNLKVEANEAVYVGDSYCNDIYGAYNAGLKPIWIFNDDGRSNQDGILRIYDIGDLKEIF